MQGFKKSVLASVWFVFLTFPFMAVRVDPIEKEVHWRLMNMVYVAVCAFVLSYLWRYMMAKKEMGSKTKEQSTGHEKSLVQRFLDNRNVFLPSVIGLSVLFVVLPLVTSTYQTNIMITALNYVVLGLGLNIVVGLAGLLDLGYVAFYAVGAYAYALLNYHFGLGFWAVLPIGGFLAMIFGLMLGFPVLRLRGDYLAIVTLGFGEIIRLVLENWSSFSMGPSGISNIDRPGFFGMEFTIEQSIVYIYYLMLALVVVTIFAVNRLKNSRLGRAWVALRDDEIACQAMGVDKTRTKLAAFALGATWAGFSGVIFAAKTTFINPASFTFMESAMILSIVVLGGMGSIIGVILGAFLLILMPEYLRAFSEYRMLIFGATMVLVMVFRPQGLISTERKTEYEGLEKAEAEAK